VRPGVCERGFALLVALVALIATGCGTFSGPTETKACSDLVSAGSGSRGDGLTEPAFLFINGSGSLCALLEPAFSFIDGSGAAIDIHQNLTPGAEGQALQLGAHKAAAIPYTFDPVAQCSQSVRFGHVVATFSGGIDVRIGLAGELCPGGRMTVSAPIPALICKDGTFAWAPPKSGVTARCQT